MSIFALLILSMFLLHNAAENWTFVSRPGEFDGISGHTAVMDSRDKMWIFGGSTDGERFGCRNWLANFDTKTLAWSEISEWTFMLESFNAPTARREHSAVMDKNDKMWIFGGATCDSPPEYSAEVFVFDTQNMQWTQPTLSGTAPSARPWPSAVMDSTQKMWIFQGRASTGSGVADEELFYLDTVACYCLR